MRFQDRQFRYTDSIEILLAITALCNHHGSQKKAAQELGVSPQYLHDILSGNREVSTKIAAKFGVRPIRLFVPIDAEPT